MRISDPLHGLTPTERAQVVRQAVAEQQVEVDKIIGALFAGVKKETAEASRPLSYWASLARDNARNPPAKPVDFWARQESLRKQRTQAAGVLPTGPFGNKEVPTIRPGVGTGLSPVEFAQGQRAQSFNQPKIGLPEPVKIETIAYDQIYTIKSEVTSPIGRILDVVA